MAGQADRQVVKKRILLADNRPDDKWTASTKEVLESEGYEVLLATTPTEARRALREEDIDLALLDVRLENDDNKEDISGVRIAMEDEFEQIPKIVITAFEESRSYGNLNKVLRPAEMERLPPAWAFLNKREKPEDLLQAMRDAFRSWPRWQRETRLLRQAVARVTRRIETDHLLARVPAVANFVVALWASLLGFGAIVVGLLLAYSRAFDVALVGAASGVLLEAIGYLFFRRVDLANARMDVYYHEELRQAHWFELLLASSDQLPGSRRLDYVERVLDAGLQAFRAARPKPAVAKELQGSEKGGE